MSSILVRIKHHEHFGSHRSTLMSVGSSSGSILLVLTKAMGGSVDPYHPHGGRERTHQHVFLGGHLRRVGNRDHHLITGSHGYAYVHGVACAAGPLDTRGCITLCNCDGRMLLLSGRWRSLISRVWTISIACVASDFSICSNAQQEDR